MVHKHLDGVVIQTDLVKMSEIEVTTVLFFRSSCIRTIMFLKTLNVASD